jgi:hypothetical protein
MACNIVAVLTSKMKPMFHALLIAYFTGIAMRIDAMLFSGCIFAITIAMTPATGTRYGHGKRTFEKQVVRADQ